MHHNANLHRPAALAARLHVRNVSFNMHEQNKPRDASQPILPERTASTTLFPWEILDTAQPSTPPPTTSDISDEAAWRESLNLTARKTGRQTTTLQPP
jgi:hypothetical protein